MKDVDPCLTNFLVRVTEVSKWLPNRTQHLNNGSDIHNISCVARQHVADSITNDHQQANAKYDFLKAHDIPTCYSFMHLNRLWLFVAHLPGVERNQSVCLLVLKVLNLFEILCMRSEEHTSELQSLMRISYAVFCLKKKQQI